MKYVEFDMSKPLDFIPIGRIAIDFNPTDMYMPLSASSTWAALRQILRWVLPVLAARSDSAAVSATTSLVTL